MNRFLLLIFVALFSFISTTMVQSDSTLKGKRILIVFGGWQGHEPRQSIEVFLPWLKAEGALVDTTSNLVVYADKAYMSTVDLIIQNVSSSTLTQDQEKGLLAAVKGGVGLAGWHGGLGSSFYQNVKYHYMVGGQWVAHPGNIIDYEVNILDTDDSLLNGISRTFSLRSEQYYMHVDPNVKVLATTTFTGKHDDWIEGATMPVVWKKTYGKGRVFYSSLGHVAADFQVHEVLEIMKRGITWAAQSKYQAIEEWVSPVYPTK